MFSRKEAIERAKQDPEFSTRRSVAKHKVKEARKTLPHSLNRRASYREHLRKHYQEEINPK